MYNLNNTIGVCNLNYILILKLYTLNNKIHYKYIETYYQILIIYIWYYIYYIECLILIAKINQYIY